MKQAWGKTSFKHLSIAVYIVGVGEWIDSTNQHIPCIAHFKNIQLLTHITYLYLAMYNCQIFLRITFYCYIW